MRVQIKDENDVKGWIMYDPETKTLDLAFPGDLEETVREYLTTEKAFKIPKSSKIDDYRVDVAVPTDSAVYFDLALCTLWRNTGAFVLWDTIVDDYFFGGEGEDK